MIPQSISYGLRVSAPNKHRARGVLDGTSGMSIPTIGREQMIRDLRDAIVTVYREPDARRKMGETARCKIESPLWTG